MLVKSKTRRSLKCKTRRSLTSDQNRQIPHKGQHAAGTEISVSVKVRSRCSGHITVLRLKEHPAPNCVATELVQRERMLGGVVVDFVVHFEVGGL